MKMIRTWLALAACLCVCTLAAATPVTWTLSGITFDDGGTAFGSFVYDASTVTFTDIDVTTTGGSERDGAIYDAPSTVGGPKIPDFLTIFFPIEAGTTSRFGFFLRVPMTDAGGTIAVETAIEFTCDATCDPADTSEAGFDIRTGTGGEITALTVPEPASLALVGIALAAVAWRRRVQQLSGSPATDGQARKSTDAPARMAGTEGIADRSAAQATHYGKVPSGSTA